MSDDSTAKRSRGVRVLGFAFAIVFALLCIAALIGYFGWQGKPAYWTEQQERISTMSSQQRQAVSESLRNRLLTEWSDPGDKTPVTQDDLFDHRNKIEIAYEDLNVWIAEEGTKLLEDVGIKMPKSVKGAMVDSPGDGLLRISCDIEKGEMKQVIAMSFAISVAEDGTLTSKLEGATAGRLPLPTQTAIDLIASRADDKGIMLDLMQGTPVEPIELPIDPSDDGVRDGRLVGLEVRDDALVITRETVRRNPSN